MPDAFLRRLAFNYFLFPRVLGTVFFAACLGAACLIYSRSGAARTSGHGRCVARDPSW